MQLKLILFPESWSVESGLFAITVNHKTLVFMSKLLGLYRGGMLELAQECYQLRDYCANKRVHINVFLNDIFAIALLLHSDAHNDSLFHEHLKHGTLIRQRIRFYIICNKISVIICN